MCDRIDLLMKIDKLEKKNKCLKEKLKCAETNFQTCNADLAALGELVGGSCFDETYDLVKKLSKALDKACIELEGFDYVFNNADYEEIKNRTEWKEWCMNDDNA